MTEQSIFLAALDIADPTERAAFLGKACAGNVTLRQKVENLLVAHAKSGFLEIPALKQMAGDGEVTQYVDSNAGEEVDLSYLSPSEKPGALGALGYYTILEVLGKGSFGTVLKAFDERLQRLVAIKVLMRELAATSPPRKRFLREARAVAAMKQENVVAIYSVEEQPLPYFVMEFVDGVTLQSKMDETGPIDISEILQIGQQIALGLASAHALGLIHRDIKPANILLERGSGQKVKLTDFGLARAADDASVTQSGTIAGTPLYMAPEQARGSKLDARTDLFSLGSVLYALATGHPPFRAPSTFAVLRRVTEDTPRPIREVISSVPDWLVAVIDKLLAKRPEDRFQAAQEVVEVLGLCQSKLLAGATPSAAVLGLKPVSVAPPANAELKLAKFPIVGIALGVIAGSLLMLFVITGSLRYLSKRNGDNAQVVNSNVGNLNADTAKVERDSVERSSNLSTDSNIAATPTPTIAPTFTNSIGMAFMQVSKGSSWMGGFHGRHGIRKAEMPYDFMIGKYEVTQSQWEAVMGSVPSSFSRKGEFKHMVVDYSDAQISALPVEWVSWNECQEFVSKLNSLTQEEGWTYRLPTPDEWEYACRGGPLTNPAESAFSYYYSQPTNVYVSEQANYGAGKLIRRVVPVGTFESNKLGLHDMHGNVWEWCGERQNDQETWKICFCGGCWNDDSIFGAEHRDRNDSTNFPDFRGNGLGFRVIRVPNKQMP